MDWIKININTPPENLDILSPYLFNLGAEGIEEKNDCIIVYFKRETWQDKIYADIKDIIKNEISQKEEIDISVNEIPTESWDEKWKENFKPFQISDDLMIYPDWEQPPTDSKMKTIIISPKMAFGTGHHETTQLILQIMPAYLKQGMSILDAGTGSGILSIYGVLMGANRVTAYDFDVLATENCRENIALNNLWGKIEVITGQLKDIAMQKYDMILANINKNVLIDIADNLRDYINKKGILILSGLLKNDYEHILSVYGVKWEPVEQKSKNEWIALVFKPKDK